MEDNVNPSGGTVEDIAQALLARENPSAATETEEVETEESQEDTPEVEEEAVDEGSSEEETDEVESDEENPEDDTEPKTFTVKVDGKDVEVTIEEALAGYMKDQDYRKKTAQTAEDRKLIEAEKQKIADLSSIREQYHKELTFLQEMNSKPLITDEKLDEILKTQGAEAYLKAKAANEKHQQQVKNLRNRLESVTQELTEDQKQEIAQRETAEREALLTALPELKDESVQKALGSYLVGFGFSQEEISSTLDHRLFVMAEKSRRYDEMVSKGKQKPVVKVPKVTKGNAPRVSGQDVKTKQLKELATKARGGKVDDLAAYLKAKST